MSRAFPLRVAAVLLGLSSTVAFAAPQAVAPELIPVTAPFVGQTFVLEVHGAAPISPIDLYFSPESGTYATPYGLLELRRNRLLLVAHGVTDVAGSWSQGFAVPLDPAWAETGAHFQALVDDPAAPAGRTFSSAVHERFLGPRVYAGFTGLRSGIYVVSGVTDSIVARVDFGLLSGAIASKPVFDATFSRGAVMASQNELLFFDPFFGGLRNVVAFPSPCSPTLLTDPDRRVAYVLELSNPARIHAIDLASGSETATFDLSRPAFASWCLGRAGAEVFVGESDPTGHSAIRRVALDPFADRGSTPVGGATSTGFGEIVYAAGVVFAATGGQETIPPHYIEGFLTRCVVSPTGLTGRTIGLWRNTMNHLTPVPAVQQILFTMNATWTAGSALFGLPLSTYGQPTGIPVMQEVWLGDMEPDGDVVWVVAAAEPQHGLSLHRLDMPSYQWTTYPYSWAFAMSDMEILRDAWNHEVWVSNFAEPPPIDIPPEILVVDELHGTSRHIALDHTAVVLHAVPLP